MSVENPKVKTNDPAVIGPPRQALPNANATHPTEPSCWLSLLAHSRLTSTERDFRGRSE
jgi:hypothetical protein